MVPETSAAPAPGSAEEGAAPARGLGARQGGPGQAAEKGLADGQRQGAQAASNRRRRRAFTEVARMPLCLCTLMQCGDFLVVSNTPLQRPIWCQTYAPGLLCASVHAYITQVSAGHLMGISICIAYCSMHVPHLDCVHSTRAGGMTAQAKTKMQLICTGIRCWTASASTALWCAKRFASCSLILHGTLASCRCDTCRHGLQAKRLCDKRATGLPCHPGPSPEERSTRGEAHQPACRRNPASCTESALSAERPTKEASLQGLRSQFYVMCRMSLWQRARWQAM